MHAHTTINPAYKNLIANLYEKSKAQIRTDIGTTCKFDILRGVKQGDLPSAMLFCIVLKIIMKETFYGLECGIRIGGEILTDEDYADDAGIMTENIPDMNLVFQRLEENAKRFGLSINIKKTKAMFIGNHSDENGSVPPIKISGKCIDIVTNFEYLGRFLTNNADDTVAVSTRIAKAWNAFQKMKHIITCRYVSKECKRYTYETYIRPVFMYGSETVTWKPPLRQKAVVFQNHIMRWMCGKRLLDKVPIKELQRMTKLTPILEEIRIRKLSWFGHLKRCSLQVKTIVEGMTPGKRKRGRPKRRWTDDICEWSGYNLSDLNAITQEQNLMEENSGHTILCVNVFCESGG